MARALRPSAADEPRADSESIRLHIGGQVAKPGWKILNVQPGPAVDYVGSCTDLSAFADASVEEVYGSHVFEHLDYASELPDTLAQIHRILVPGGRLHISVPDLEVLCRLLVDGRLPLQDRFLVMRMMFGGQTDPFDYHKVGLTWEFLCSFLTRAGFHSASRIPEHGLFNDTSSMRFYGQLISLNVRADKAAEEIPSL